MTQELIQKNLDQNREMIERIPLEDKQEWKEEFVKELSYKVKYFCCGQYEEHSVEMDAFQSGVSTAIGMMSIDLLGGVKSKGMLELYTERLLKEERNVVLSDIKEGLVLLRKHDGEKYALDKNLEYSKGVGETLTKVSEILELIKHE